MFLCQFARADNTRVELAPDSQLSVYYENIYRAHRLLRTRRDFTSQLVPRRAFLEQGGLSWVLWLAHLAVIAAAVVACPSLVALLLGLVVLVAMWCWVIVSVRQQQALLQAPKLRLTIPWLTLARPLMNLSYRVRELRHKKSNYTTYI